MRLSLSLLKSVSLSVYKCDGEVYRNKRWVKIFALHVLQCYSVICSRGVRGERGRRNRNEERECFSNECKWRKYSHSSGGEGKSEESENTQHLMSAPRERATKKKVNGTLECRWVCVCEFVDFIGVTYVCHQWRTTGNNGEWPSVSCHLVKCTHKCCERMNASEYHGPLPHRGEGRECCSGCSVVSQQKRRERESRREEKWRRRKREATQVFTEWRWISGKKFE